jgi:hypothetical protein
MSSISLRSTAMNSTGSDNETDFKHEFLELITSLQAGNNPAADAAFAAIKLEFQKFPSITVSRNESVKRPSKQTSRHLG